MNRRIYQVDAFADSPFTGNPAAVCPLDGPGDTAWMQAVAQEMNLSETAFWWPENGRFGLRWFTPAAEVDLCGHATLASAHVAAQTGLLADGASIVFDTRSGALTVRRRGDRYEMDFPALEISEPVPPPDGLLAALGLDPAALRSVVRSRFDLVVEVADESVVRSLNPSFGPLKSVDARGVIVTAPGDDPKVDFVSRFFGPAVGVDEDPVTGSAHCCLAPYWQAKLEKSALKAHQVSRRGGRIDLELRGDRVLLRGSAVTVMVGDLLV